MHELIEHFLDSIHHKLHQKHIISELIDANGVCGEIKKFTKIFLGLIFGGKAKMFFHNILISV